MILSIIFVICECDLFIIIVLEFIFTNKPLEDASHSFSGDATPERAFALVVNASDLKMHWW